MTQGARLSAWYFCYFGFIGIFLPFFGLYLQSIHLSVGRIAILMSLGQFMRLLAPMFWAQLATSANRLVRTIVASTTLACVSFMVVFATEDFAALLLGLLVMHFCWSASLPLVESLTLRHLSSQPERYGRIRLWGSVGFIVAVAGGGALLDVSSLAALLWGGWGLMFCTFAVTTTLSEARSIPLGEAILLSTVFKQRKLRYLLAAGFCMLAAHGALYIFYSIYLAGQGYSATIIGALWALGVLAEIAVFTFLPGLSRRHSMRRILLLSFALAALRFATIGWGAAHLSLLILAQLLHGATFGAHHAATMAALNKWVAPGQQANGQAIYGSVAYGAGGLAGSLLAGQIWSQVGPALTFSVASLVALLGLILVWRGIPDEFEGRPVR